MKRVLLAIAFVAVAAGAGVVYQTGLLVPAQSQTEAPPPRQTAAVPVTVAAAKREPVPARLETIGNVQTIASVAVKSRIDAYITEVRIQDGQYVKAGDVLFRLDSRAAEAQVHQMEGQLARDRAQLANAKRETERQQPLAAKDFVSRQQYDQVVTTAQSLEAAVKADEAALENAKVLLTYYTITAPLDGRVGAINLKAGNNVKSNDLALVTINQMKPIYVGFSLPQTELPGVRAALAAGPVEVVAEAAGDSGPPEKGRVTFFDNAVDTGTGTIAMKATFANDRERLWPGQFVNVAVTLRTDPDALIVPEAAVQVGQNGTYVWLVKPDATAEMRPVKVSRTVDGKSVVAEGLAPGDTVVTDGQLRLTTGSRVQVKDPAPRQPGAAS
jgi:multidrug efflux system membrane fusion protein